MKKASRMPGKFTSKTQGSETIVWLLFSSKKAKKKSFFTCDNFGKNLMSVETPFIFLFNYSQIGKNENVFF